MNPHRRSISILALSILAAEAGFPGDASAGRLPPGHVLIADAGAGTDFRGAVLTVDPVSGQRAVQSDFGNPAQGPLGLNMRDVAVAPDGRILVTDPFVGTSGLGALFAVDAGSGDRTLLSDFGDPAQGPLGGFPIGLAVGSAGAALVVDSQANALFEVALDTGQRTVRSDFSDSAQGPLGQSPVRVAVDLPSGTVWVADSDAGTGQSGALFRVDPQSGERVLVSDFGAGGQGPTAAGLGGLAVEASGAVVVAAIEFPNPGRVLRVDRVSGARSVLTDFAAGGPTCITAGAMTSRDLGVAADGTILAVASDSLVAPSGHLFAIDPASGARSLVSCFIDPGQGPLGESPIGIGLSASLVFADGFESGDLGAWSAATP